MTGDTISALGLYQVKGMPTNQMGNFDQKTMFELCQFQTNLHFKL